MKVWVRGGGEIVLGQNNFVGQGGEGAVYAKGDTAFKIYTDPKRMIAIGKIDELRRLVHPAVMRPKDVLCNQQGDPIGYSMRYVQRAWVLCQLLTRVFRERHHIAPAMMAELVGRLRDGIAAVHDAGALVVDLNEMNFLITPDFKEVFFIDVDSYQTPHYPATALADSVRDWHAQVFSELSDWFSFAVVSFQMFTGIHPYKGKHPTVRGLEERMRANLSVLGSEVRVPRSAYPFESIPDPYHDWFRAVLEDGERTPPPSDLASTLRRVTKTVKTVLNKGALDIREVGSFGGPVTGIWATGEHTVIGTADALWLDGHRVASQYGCVHAVGFSPRLGRPIAVIERKGLELFDMVRGCIAPLGLTATAIHGHDGRVYLRSREQIVELVVKEIGDRVIAGSRVAAAILEHATQTFDGVAIQNLLGSTYASLFVARGSTQQCRIPELDDCQIVDAKLDGNVLMAICHRDNRYDRFIFRFDSAWVTYDVRVARDVPLTGLNFVTLDTGVCVCLDEDERLELFSAQPGSQKMKVVEDEMLGGDMRLAKRGGQVLYAQEDKVYSMRMR